jgi:hypothetical protein
MTISKDDLKDAAFLSSAAYAATSNDLIPLLTSQGWTPIGASELGLSPFLFGIGLGDSNFLYDNDNAQAFVALKDNVLALSFTGTDSVADLIDDFIGGTTSFLEHYNQYAQLIPAVYSFAAQHGLRILVTGHSLGGAMAELFMVKNTRSDVTGITFGSPGVDGVQDS